MSLQDYIANCEVLLRRESYAIIKAKALMPGAFAIICDEDEITVPKSRYNVEFEVNEETDELTEVRQDIEMKNGFRITTEWGWEKGITDIAINTHGDEEEYTFEGLVIVEMMTWKGDLSYWIP